MGRRHHAARLAEILEAAADHSALEQTFKDFQEVSKAGQQQVRNVHAGLGAFNLPVWMHRLAEAWAWAKPAAALVDRAASPLGEGARRPSHADKRKTLQHAMLRQQTR